MQLKRYSTQELQKICTDILFDYLLEENSKGMTHVGELRSNYVNNLHKYDLRIEICQKALNRNDLEPRVAQSLRVQLNYLETGRNLLAQANMENQKKHYNETHKTDFCRTTVLIPLDKKINSYYDDLTLQVLFYDDVCTPRGQFEKFIKLKALEEKREFLKQNIEITNMGLAYIKDGTLKAIIALKGELNTKDSRVKESGVTLFPQKFSDFENLRLVDTSEIHNNDLKQLIQSKINLDKEDMQKLSSILIRGDKYEIYKSNDDELFIRYVCRSTGRVYYNRLVLSNLELSSYFKENDYDSYSKAWWNLNTLGGNPDGEPVIRC